ncbi:MAG: hypothetical protein KGQ36_04700 [Rickettsiales bacterium]|nr:hypothetical protein [Rickettsiales bacterium]
MIKNLNLISSKTFLLISCIAIFLLSIFLRSIIDIGPDTGVYIDLGTKIANGKKYYYDFFESNFPLSFYIYALEYKISAVLHISPIITSEIFINIFALLSIFWSAKILQRSTIYDNKAHYNLIIIAYFIGFFLRIEALSFGEFGTKTSFFLIGFYPYISFAFERKKIFTKLELWQKGFLMGFIACLKPHYLIIIIFLECYNFWQKKSFSFFFELDKLVMILIGCSYLLLMLKFTPEFFEFMVPMWGSVYYDTVLVFIKNSFHQFASKGVIYSFIFLIFSRLKLSQNDKILLLLYCVTSLLMVLENIGTIDQEVIFYQVATICFLKLIYDVICSKKIILNENKFIIITLMFLPIFDLNNLPFIIFSASGFIVIWWLIALIFPFIFIGKIKKEKLDEYNKLKLQGDIPKKILFAVLLYFLLLIIAFLSLKYFGPWAFVTTNLLSLFIVIFFFERFYAKFYNKFSPFTVFVVLTSISFLFYGYVRSFDFIFDEKTYSNKNFTTFNDNVVYYSKIYAPNKEDGILAFSNPNQYRFPIMNYLGKDNYYRGNFMAFNASNAGKGKMFLELENKNKIFTLTYFMESLKEQLRNKKMKVLFINNGFSEHNEKDRCLISYLEYYFLDPEFKKLFFENFRYEARMIEYNKSKISKNIFQKKKDVFDSLEPSTSRVSYDFEVYVRN